MKISARNQLRGKVVDLTTGAVNTVVKIQLTGDPVITAVVTNEAAHQLELTEGGDACALVKASNVMVGVCEKKTGCDCQ